MPKVSASTSGASSSPTTTPSSVDVATPVSTDSPADAPARRSVAHAGRAAAVAVGALFATNGLVIGGYVGVLPALRARYGIEAATLAVLLFCAGAAAVVSMQLGGRLADRIGGRRVVLVALSVLTVGAAVLASAPTFPVAVVGGMLIGWGTAPPTWP